MKPKKLLSVLILLTVIQQCFLAEKVYSREHSSLVEGKKVLIVASYHLGYKWCDEIIQTLKHELAGAEITVFYMDTKRNLQSAAEKAKEAKTKKTKKAKGAK